MKTLMWSALVPVLALALSAFVLSGCYESPQANIYTPGEYKGPTDPLLERQADAAHQEALRERFALVQEDR